MGKGKKSFKKKFVTQFNYKNKIKRKDEEPINKKAIFNRYKNKQRIEEEILKKKQLDEKLQKSIENDESMEDEEEDALQQLVSTFNNNHTQASVHNINSDSTESDDDEKLESNEIDSFISNELKSQRANISDHENGSPNIDVVSSDNEEPETSEDPFTDHFEYDLSDELLVSLGQSQTIRERHSERWDVLGDINISIPSPLETSATTLRNNVTVLEPKTYAPSPKRPSVKYKHEKLYIKPQIFANLAFANKKNLVKAQCDMSILTPFQTELLSVFAYYHDFYFPERTFFNAEDIRFAYCFHVLNHMLKTRTKILHHNAKLSKNNNTEEEYRDQGLVRPKVLIMVPFKDAAYRIVKCLIDILVPDTTGQVVNKNRFEEDFTGGEISMPKKNPKPEDYELLFRGNTDDTFRLGMSVTKKTLKLYTNFYSSDIIVASPLGLRMIIGAEGEEDRDYDFLSSIEILVMDQADVFAMQNWDHVLHVLDHLHLQPKKTHKTDFSRVRSWAINGWSKYYRQTLIFSGVEMPELKSVINKRCFNYAGNVCVRNKMRLGALREVVVQVPQFFHRFKATSIVSSVDDRFECFVKEILPRHRDKLMSQTLIYVPSYFDYVRIRNYFKKEDIGFVQICEYSKEAKIARARDMFFHSEAHFLLYSERVHFFKRLRVKGIRHIIFYQPPTYAHFYTELCNLMQECYQNKYGGSEFNMTVTIIYSEYDRHTVTALLGDVRAAEVFESTKTIHTFVTDDK